MSEAAIKFEDLLAQGMEAAEEVVDSEPVTDKVELAEDEPKDKLELADTPDEVEPEADPVPEQEPEAVADPEEETYRQRYENLQSKLGEQGQELGTLRQQIEALTASRQEPETVEPAFGFQPRVPTTPQELLEMASTGEEAIDAFEFAAQHAPDLVPEVLAEIRYHDSIMAERLQLGYVQSLVESRVAPVDQRFHANDEVVSTGNVIERFAATVEGWDDIKDEVATILDEEPWLIESTEPSAVARGLRAATKMAQQARQLARRTVDAQQAEHSAQARQDAVVETGTRSAAPPVENVSESQSIADAIFAEDRRIREARGA